MAFANADVTDIIATTLSNRSKKIADNVTNNNALLSRLNQKGNIKTASGGRDIMQELSFAESGNAGWYSGYDLLPVGVSDVISGAIYDWKQAACPVVISGLEMLQNSGKESMIDLMESRLEVAEATMANLITAGLYSDGTGAGGKEIDGLAAAIPIDPTATPYGGINGDTYTFWQNAVKNSADATTLESDWNELWSQLVRGQDRPDLIMVDSGAWNAYLSLLQGRQQFVNTNTADNGFSSIKFMTADVVLDGGLYFPSAVSGGTGAPTNTAYFLNSKYLKYRPHSQRNMVPLSPNRRYSTNQDAETVILAWAGNLCVSGRAFQGIWDGNA